MEHLRIQSAVNANLQNVINTSLIVHYVRNHGPVYRSIISRDLSLSLPAVSRAVESLLKQGYFVEKRIITQAGRKAHEIEINSNLGISIGIAIELPFIRIGRLNMAGELVMLEEADISIKSSSLQDQLIEFIDQFISQEIDSEGNKIPVVAICISVPAAVEKSQEAVYAVLYQSMHELNLKKILHNRYHIPVILENNENLTVLAEKYYKGGIPEQDVVFITVHHGIGAGLFLNGQLYRGKNGAAGEIGQQPIHLNPLAGHSYTETFESIASIHQIQQIALNAIHRGDGEDIFEAAEYKYQNITHHLVSSMAAQGSENARKVLANYAKILAIGISSVLVTINPELVILGGMICELYDPDTFLIKPLIEHLQDLVPFPVPEIRMTRLGLHAAVFGACQYALENTIFSEFPYIIG
ncbi:MAG: ROK family protein [Bacteroidetes bacterium]|nr:ROK family protein [Bacteroidota bacterium]